MDWGLGNPNKTAALIASLMIAVWGLSYLRREGFYIAAAAWTALGVCLIHTFSRGGIVAALLGMGITAWFAPRPWKKARIAALLGGLAVVLATALFLNAHQRVGQGITSPDRSISNRLLIWKAAPKMIYDAPWGWGLGNSVQAYMEWYQPLDRSEKYRTLVNSHLTWLIEFSWPLRFLYLFGWLAIFAVCWPPTGTAWLSIPLGIWVSFAVAAFFSAVGESLVLWVVPILSLIPVLATRLIHQEWPSRTRWLQCLAISLISCGILWVAGKNALEIRASSNVVTVGKPPWVWVVSDQKALGKFPGRVLRQFWEDKGSLPQSLAITPSLLNVPLGANAIVVAGECSPQELDRLETFVQKGAIVILLAPSFSPQEMRLPETIRRVLVIYGEFSQSPQAPAWKAVTTFQRIRGAGDYFPAWPENILHKFSNRVENP